MSNAVKVFTPAQQDDPSFHAALADCLSGDAKQRLLGLVKTPPAEAKHWPSPPDTGEAALTPQAAPNANETN